MGEQQKSSKETIIDGKNGGCGPVQQGLVRKSTQEPDLETRSMQPRGWMAEPSMAIPVVHIAPPGTNAMDARWVARWLTGSGLVVVCPNRCTRTRMGSDIGGAWECGCTVGARPQWIPENTEKLENGIFFKKFENPKKDVGCPVTEF